MVCQRLGLVELDRMQTGPLPALFPFGLFSQAPILQLFLLLGFFVTHEIGHTGL